MAFQSLFVITKLSAKRRHRKYEKENIERVYSAYHLLHGNDIATGLYNKVLAMPTERVIDDA